MFILENVPLSGYSTMRLGGPAKYLTEVSSRSELQSAIQWAQEHAVPCVLIGGGSNIVWGDAGFNGLVIVNKIMGFEVQTLTDTEYYLTAGAGMNWDEFVAKSVELGLTGIEFLSLVPGSVGATPVQNVGAYGQEVATTIVTIEAYDAQQGAFVTLRGSECDFSYRGSRFKYQDKGRFFISAVTFFLRKGNPEPPFYAAVEQYRQQQGITVLTPAVGREAVIAIRSAKLPDPALVANNGSFFANPIVSSSQFLQLQALNPDIAHWQMPNSNDVKLSAAWLIDQAGLKDVHDAETGMATWSRQPLVLVNEAANNTADLLKFRQKIIDAVQQKFGVTLEQEPEFIEKA